MTFAPAGGCIAFDLDLWDRELSRLCVFHPLSFFFYYFFFKGGFYRPMSSVGMVLAVEVGLADGLD